MRHLFKDIQNIDKSRDISAPPSSNPITKEVRIRDPSISPENFEVILNRETWTYESCPPPAAFENDIDSNEISRRSRPRSRQNSKENSPLRSRSPINKDINDVTVRPRLMFQGIEIRKLFDNGKSELKFPENVNITTSINEDEINLCVSEDSSKKVLHNFTVQKNTNFMKIGEKSLVVTLNQETIMLCFKSMSQMQKFTKFVEEFKDEKFTIEAKDSPKWPNSRKVDHSYSHSSDRAELVLKCDYFKEQLLKKDQEVKKLRVKLSRARKEIREQTQKINNLMRDLEKEKLMDTAQTRELLNKMSEDLVYSLIKRENKSGKKVRPKKYSMEVNNFAQTLRFYSTKGYEYCRKYLALPSISTLNSHLQNFRCMPGFIGESFDELNKHKGDPNYKYASLVVDGIHLKELVEICPDLKMETFGKVDYGKL